MENKTLQTALKIQWKLRSTEKKTKETNFFSFCFYFYFWNLLAALINLKSFGNPHLRF